MYAFVSTSPVSSSRSPSLAATATRPSATMKMFSTNSLVMLRGVSRVYRLGYILRHINSTNISLGITVPEKASMMTPPYTK